MDQCAEWISMNVVVFGRALAELSVDDIRAIAFDLQAARASTADEVAGTRAMLFIEQTLRRTHRLHDAASAALGVATNVQQVAERGHLDLPDDDVTRVARAAAQIARGMIVGDYPGVDDALHALGKGWHRLACLAEFQAA
jgi:hypothetical protein